MKNKLVPSGILAVALVGCQNADYINPDETNTGTPPAPATQVFAFDSAHAPTYLDANLEQTNAVQAAFVNTEAGITVMPVNGQLPDSAGAEANLLEGVGFGTYPNPDYRADVDWATAGDFKSTVTAEITFTSNDDVVVLCRSFATTCVEFHNNPAFAGGAADVALVRLAANAPDTEIGEISPGVSAAIRGSGENGLTIAVTDPQIGVVALPFLANAGTPFTAEWTLARGTIENSYDWSVSINGTEIGSGNSATDLAASIVKPGGVGLVFDTPLGSADAQPPYAIDYTYTFDGWESGDFEDPTGFGVPLSPQTGLGWTPLYVYPTVDDAHAYATFSGTAGTPHAVQAADGVLGMLTAPPGSSNQTFVYSVAYNGDDFDGLGPLEGNVDFGIAGGGFYPSPAFAYSQTLPAITAKVQAGVRAEVHRLMYSKIATGVASANSALPTLAAAITGQDFPVNPTYTPLTPLADFITIGTDYADNNVDDAISTSCDDTYNVTLTNAKSTTFRTELGAIVDALLLEVAGDPIWMHLSLTFETQVLPLIALDIGLNTPPGVQDGMVDAEGNAVFDGDEGYPLTDPCAGYDCNVNMIVGDIVNGNDFTGQNESGEGVPALASLTLWGLADSAAVDAQAAVLVPDSDFYNDHPAYPAVPAAPATPPVREVASASINLLIQGIFGNFVGAVYGPGVPASNFSLLMGAGDPDAASGPLLTTLTISAE